MTKDALVARQRRSTQKMSTLRHQNSGKYILMWGWGQIPIYTQSLDQHLLFLLYLVGWGCGLLPCYSVSNIGEEIRLRTFACDNFPGSQVTWFDPIGVHLGFIFHDFKRKARTGTGPQSQSVARTDLDLRPVVAFVSPTLVRGIFQRHPLQSTSCLPHSRVPRMEEMAFGYPEVSMCRNSENQKRKEQERRTCLSAL